MKIRVLALLLTVFCVLPLVVACDGGETAHTEHTYGEWKEVVAATCGTGGAKVRTCTCGAFESEEIAVTGTHTYGEWEVLAEVTCGAGGVNVRRCKCGVADVQTLPATGEHSYQDGVCATCGHWQYGAGHVHDEGSSSFVEVLVSNCGRDGVRLHYCECGAITYEVLEHSGLHRYNSTGICTVCGAGSNHIHSYGAWNTIAAPDCGRDGLQLRQCACGHTDHNILPRTSDHSFNEIGRCEFCDIRHPAHTYSEWIEATAPTCSLEGMRVRACVCGDFEMETIPATGEHTYENYFCTACGACTVEGGKLNGDGRLVVTDINGTDRAYDDLPEELDYNKTPVQILYWSDVEKSEFEQDAEYGNLRGDAIYRRNIAIEKRLNVRLRFKACRGNGSYSSDFVRTVENDIIAGVASIDIVAAYSRTMGQLLVKGLLTDLTSTENSYLDFDKPWWPKNLVSDLGVGDGIYLLTGDMSPTMLDEMHCVYFNTEQANTALRDEAATAGMKNGTEYLFDLVRKGNWTVDRMVEYASRYYRDTDYSADKDWGDVYGMCSINYCAASLYGSAGLRMVENRDGGWQVSSDITSSNAARLSEMLKTLFASDGYWDNRYGPYTRPFEYGNALFCVQYYEMAENGLVHNEAVTYGVLPCPKLSAGKNTEYRTVLGNSATFYGVSAGYKTNGDADSALSMMTAVLECWASEGYRNTTPAILRVNAYAAQSPYQEELLEMYEVIRGGVMADPGRIAASGLGIYVDSNIISDATAGKDWETVDQGYADDLHDALLVFSALLNGGGTPY